MEFEIVTTWDNIPVKHDPVHLDLTSDPSGGLRLDIRAPFWGSPEEPLSPPGPCPQLWDYEVAEAFFLNDKNQYLEVEFCPHGHHLVLFLNGRRNIVQEQLPLDYHCKVIDDHWQGSAVIPPSYFPPLPTLFNAFAIHGDGDKRVYEALYPATDNHSTPDFHRLEYFRAIDLKQLSSSLVEARPSQLWQRYSSLSIQQ